VLPAWRHRRVQDVTRREIRELVEKKARTAPIMANRLLARISRLFSFAIERDWIEANPAFRMRRPSQEISRDRVLSRSELKELWKVLHQTGRTFRPRGRSGFSSGSGNLGNDQVFQDGDT
jgi:site-specific recombinase XerD